MFSLLPTLLAATCAPAAAAENSGVGSVAANLDDQVVAVAHFDLTRVDLDVLFANISALTAAPAREVAKDDIGQWLREMEKAGGGEFYAVFSLADLPGPPYLLIPARKGADVEALRHLLTGPQAKSRMEVCERVGDVLFAGSKSARDRLRAPKTAPRPDLASAFSAAGDRAIQVALLTSPDARRAIEDTLPQLPAELGGGPVTILTRGLRWAALGADLTPKLSLRVTVQSQDAEAARRLADWLQTTMKRIGDHPEVRQVWHNFDELAAKIRPEVKGDRLTLAVDEPTLRAFIEPTAPRVRAASDRNQSANNLKQIGLALHNFHDVHKAFPPSAIYGKDGKALLSWRVAVLPYLDQDNLYKQFKLDEPWDSENNKKLVAQMPAVYRSAKSLAAGKTTYLGVTGKDAMFRGEKPVSIREVTDGTSNTIFVVDADDAKSVPWTKPEEFAYDPAQPTAGLGGRYDGMFVSLFVDGSVRFISSKINGKTLTALFTRNGGEAIGEIP
jgi:hypothetical protein